MTPAQYIAQSVLFSDTPSYSTLTALPAAPSPSAKTRINVWRNHAFEPLIPLIGAYHSHTGWQADFALSGYDDSLSFQGWAPAAAEVLWLDPTRLSLAGAQDPAAYAAWLATRLAALRVKTSAPVILLTWFSTPAQKEQVQAHLAPLPGVYMADLADTAHAGQAALLDPHRAAFTGSPVNHKLHPVLARTLACHWLHAALRPALKAVAVDLDNTLYAGILGEDGSDGVSLTDAHRRLQEYLCSLRRQGIFIALVSRNIPDDVMALFATRTDFPLRWDDFSATAISWGDKGEALASIAQELRIATDSILYIDDNIGELASVTRRNPDLPCIYAHQDASLTLAALRHYPGLWRWHTGADDGKRVADLASAAARADAARSATSAKDYYASLQTTLTLRLDPREDMARLAELCAKTNQFNLSLRRLQQADLARYMDDPNACVASIQLADMLSDSGTIGVIAARRSGLTLEVAELCISCRALGRGLEDTMIFSTLRAMPLFADCDSVSFYLAHAPRNMPARAWLAQHSADSTLQEGLHILPANRIATAAPCGGVIIERKD